MRDLRWIIARTTITCLTLGHLSCNAQSPDPFDGCLQGYLTNPDIHESSGLTRSQLRDDLYWTHNDSGDTARVFAINSRGQHVAECRVPGANAIDWEDIGSFARDGQSYLILADTGDNGLHRDDYQLYVVQERVPPAETLPLVATWCFRYEDGAQNCEAIAVDMDQNQIVLIGKSISSSSPVYVIDLPPRMESRQDLVARRIGTVRMTSVTAMDISPDGQKAVLATYFDATEFLRSPSEEWTDAFSRRGNRIRVPPRIQGESICYDRDCGSLFLTSEKLPTPLFRVLLGERLIEESALDQVVEQASQGK